MMVPMVEMVARPEPHSVPKSIDTSGTVALMSPLTLPRNDSHQSISDWAMPLFSINTPPSMNSGMASIELLPLAENAVRANELIPPPVASSKKIETTRKLVPICIPSRIRTTTAMIHQAINGIRTSS